MSRFNANNSLAAGFKYTIRFSISSTRIPLVNQVAIYEGALPGDLNDSTWYSGLVASNAASAISAAVLQYGTTYNVYVRLGDSRGGFGTNTSTFTLASSATCNPVAEVVSSGGSAGPSGEGSEDGLRESAPEFVSTPTEEINNIADEVFGPLVVVDSESAPVETEPTTNEPLVLDNEIFQELLNAILDEINNQNLRDDEDKNIAAVIETILGLAYDRGSDGINSTSYNFGDRFMTLLDGTILTKSPSYFDSD